MRYTISLTLASLLAGMAAWTPACAGVPVVVADIPPVHSLVAMVMGDLGQPVLLLEPGADAHDFQMRPSQAAALADAGLVVWIGPQMSPWLDRALDGAGKADVSRELLSAEGTHVQPYADAGGDVVPQLSGNAHAHAAGDADGAAEAASDYGDADAHGHAKDGEAIDPHAWLDPHNAPVWVGLIAADLSRLDPANAATYAANAAQAAARIREAEGAAAATLAPVRDRPFVVFHDAYGYFTGHFGLTLAGAITPGDAASPGAARLRALGQRVAEGGAPCVFPEANHDPDLAAQMARAGGARLGAPLDPEGALLVPGPDLYPQLLTGMATTLAGCLADG